MANISNNTTYSGNAPRTIAPPSTIFQNLAEMKRQGGSPFAPENAPSAQTPADYERLKKALMYQYGQQADVPQAVPFYPAQNPDPNGSSPVPTDYTGFAEPGAINQPDQGINFSWQSPVSPVIQNMPGDVPGQYIKDTSNPDALIKSIRGDYLANQPLNKAILQNRPSSLYQIDHIIPLALGGADTMANRQVLTMDQNDKKTRAQAIPYTLYTHGLLNLEDARKMSMEWKDRDLSDIPQPDSYGMVPLKVAQRTIDIWAQPKVPTFQDKMAALPQEAKDFGKGWLPDSVREFMKGAANSFTLGFVPYEQGEDQDASAWWAGKAGQLAGGAASFALGYGLLGKGLQVAGLAGRSLMGLTGVSLLKGADAGFKTAKALEAATAFKSLNQAPSYLRQLLTPKNIQIATKLGAVNAGIMQGSKLIEHHLSPEILAGLKEGTPEYESATNQIADIFKDIAIGGISGIASPTLKGAALATMLPTTLYYIGDPDNPVEALANGVAMGAFHMVGAKGKRAEMDRVLSEFNETANKAAHASLNYYAPNIMKDLKPGELVPASMKTEEAVQAAKDEAIKNLWSRYFGIESSLPSKMSDSKISNLFKKGTDILNKNKVETGMTLDDTLNEFKRITASARQLYKGGLDAERRAQADIDDLLSFGKMAKAEVKSNIDSTKTMSNLENRFTQNEKMSRPGVAKQVVEAFKDTEFGPTRFNKSFIDVPDKGPAFFTGDVQIAGAELKSKESRYWLSEKAKGNASAKMLLVDSPETGFVWKLKNNVLVQDFPDKLKSGEKALDPHPENAIQAFGIIKNPETKQNELIPLGWVSGDFRLNKATHSQNKAINQHEKVLSGEMPAIKYTKDDLAPKMRQAGTKVLIVNVHPHTGISNKDRVFVAATFNNANWDVSKAFKSTRNAQIAKNETPIQSAIADLNSARTSKEQSKHIQNVVEKVKSPAARMIPKISTNGNRGELEQEVATTLFDDIATVQNSKTSQEAQQTAKVLLDWDMTPEDAQNMIFRKGQSTPSQDAEIIVNAAKTGKLGRGTVARLKLAKPFLESDSMKTSSVGKVFPKLKTSGGIEDYPVETPSVTPEMPSTATLETPMVSGTIEPRNVSKVDSLADTFSQEGMNQVEDLYASKRMGGSYNFKQHEDLMDGVILRTEEKVQSTLQNQGVPQNVINEVKNKVSSDLSNVKFQKLDAISRPTKSLNQDEAAAVTKEGIISPSTNLNGPENIKYYEKIARGDSGAELPVYKAKVDEVSTEPVPMPVVTAGETIKNIREGMKAPKGSLPYFYNTGLDRILNYLQKEKKVDVVRYLSTGTPEGKRLWNSGFFNELNSKGKPLTQPKDVINARATGGSTRVNKEMGTAYKKRTEDLKNNPVNEFGGGEGNLTKEEMAKMGFDPEDALDTQAAGSMGIKSALQDDNMVQDMIQGDNLMAGISSDKELTPSIIINDLRSFLMGGGGSPGLIKYINNDLKAKGKRGIFFDDKKGELNKIFGPLEKEALEAEQGVEKVRKMLAEYKILTKNYEPGEPLPSYIKEMKKELVPLVEKYKGLLDALK